MPSVKKPVRPFNLYIGKADRPKWNKVLEIGERERVPISSVVFRLIERGLKKNKAS